MKQGLDLFNLTGKTALITGSSHGLGMAVAKALGQAGATIVINGSNQERLDKAVQEYASVGITAHPYVFDVTQEQLINDNVCRIEQEVGPIDILVNNAGIIKRIPALEMSQDDWDQVINIDLTAPFLMSRRIAASMKQRGGGKIINMCSMMSEVGRDTVSAYAAAKGGLKMLTRNLATEWARYNIQVNGIGPGYFATSQTAPIRVNGHPFHEFILKRTPAERWGEPDDLGGTAIFLASAASNFITGQIIYVDGGILASLGKAANEQ